jgi:pyruvate formate lyase activating enzyme
MTVMPEAQNWRNTYQPARLGESLPNGVVRCHLSPRHCTLKEGAHGFCGVRANRDGRLVTMNYGKSVHATEETIETEAVNHFSPGERILSMGNIGCMLNCTYCHNWKTSQAKYVEDRDVHMYTPEQVVDIALRHRIRMLSWTYNDPVVWHEFVVDTAKLARKHGLMNLYKSAFYISPEAIAELIPVMDIFSISLKAVDEDYYRKITSGHLQPVLDGIKQVYRSGVHLEVSNLMITDISDDEKSARKISDWVLKELDPTVPVHFVRFHPDYKMRDTTRTPIERVIRARAIGREMGLQHVYVGNVYDTPYSNTFCNGCEQLLVDRYGLNAQVKGLDQNGRCTQCALDAHIKMRGPNDLAQTAPGIPEQPGLEVKTFRWHGDVRSLHVQAKNTSLEKTTLYVQRMLKDGKPGPCRAIPLLPDESFRFIVAQSLPDESGARVAVPGHIQSNLHEVFDRAHFPTVSLEDAGVQKTDVSPLPAFR